MPTYCLNDVRFRHKVGQISYFFMEIPIRKGCVQWTKGCVLRQGQSHVYTTTKLDLANLAYRRSDAHALWPHRVKGHKRQCKQK